MVCSTFLEEVAARTRDLLARSHLIQRSVTVSQLNWKPGNDLWSMGQIYDHLNISNELYFEPLHRALEFGRAGNPEVRHSFFGKLIIKSTGPSGNAPVPKKLLPRNGPFDEQVFIRFAMDEERLLELLKTADDVDLTKTRFRNPILPVIRMNLSDALEIMASHAERHIGQVEQLVRRPDYPA
jgi:hypothetical protein